MTALLVSGGAVKYKNDRAFASNVDFGIKIVEVGVFGGNSDGFFGVCAVSKSLMSADLPEFMNEPAKLNRKKVLVENLLTFKYYK